MKIRIPGAVAIVIALALCSVSCSSHSEGSSFASRLDDIDAFISQNSNDSALKALKKLEKKAFSSYERLGIYKRYITLGETKTAEKILVKGLKKLPGNYELSAVYGNFLLRHNRLEEAFSVSCCLEDSPYSSIYSECVLRKALESIGKKGEVLEDAFSAQKKKQKKKKNSSENTVEMNDRRIRDIFCNEKFVSVYKGAFKGSKENKWVFNAASVLMKNGNYREAAELYPQKITNYRDSLFWGCIFFDAGLYAQSLSALEASSRLASLDGTGDYSTEIYAEILGLESDCCYVEGEDKRSEELRNQLIAMSEGKYITPLTCINGAMYSKRQNDTEEEYRRIGNLTEQFPDYIPGLAAYGQLAVEQLNQPAEDKISAQLRTAGLKTLEMEERDRIPRIFVENVYSKIDSVEDSGKNPDLQVLKATIETEKLHSARMDRPVSDIWGLLEKNESPDGYPQQIVHYCTSALVEEKMYKEAAGLFDGYMKRKYDFEITGHPEDIELWECEYAAWFACEKGDFKTGIELYRFITERYGTRLPALNSSASNSSVINAFVNLAVVYESIDLGKEALDMLTKAGARAADGKKKAEILFRMAELSWKMGDSRSASRSLKYALTLDSSSNKSRLLLKKIRAEK